MEEIQYPGELPGWRDQLGILWDRHGYPCAKRTIDFVGALLLLITFAPLCLIVSCWIAFDSTGPIIFRQSRIGRNGRPFTMYKFRSMHINADQSIHRQYVVQLLRTGASGEVGLYKVPNDRRVTRLGVWLRKLSIDELPQLFNVLRGDMSLVGPRPPLAYEVQEYEPWVCRRLEVRPGMTGLWQVSGRSKVGVQEMFRLDVEYVERRSLGLDLKILLLTIPTVLFPGTAA
jgi:lipopolysaccharide/colanic/teichoic acid biosynthesis glycosyltransferase